MAQTQTAGRDANTVLIRIMAGGLAVLFLAALALWVSYGPAVFLDMLATAWAYCF